MRKQQPPPKAAYSTEKDRFLRIPAAAQIFCLLFFKTAAIINYIHAGVLELADEADSKSDSSAPAFELANP